MAPSILEVKKLCRSISENNQSKLIVNNISYRFHKEKIYTVIGPSGAGKSSLLRLLNRLDEPTSGEVLFNSENYTTVHPVELRKKIGYLFQTPYLFDGTVKENLTYACNNFSDEELYSLISKVHIKKEMLSRSVDNLSIGEKQRVAIARLLAVQPEIILLDEPTSALDPGHTKAIENLIKEIVSSEKITAIVVTHLPQQALYLGEETLLLVNGKLVEHGNTQNVINNPQTEEGKLYKSMEIE